MVSGYLMKAMALIITVLYLLQPFACFTHPCESYLGGSDTVDTSGTTTHSHDADNCDSSACCAVCIHADSLIAVTYAPLVSDYVVSEQYFEFPQVVIPIPIPPQILS
jgi:hypothetical protein